MKIEVGRVIKAQGIKGEVKVACYLDSPEMLAKLKKLYVGTKAYSVKSSRAAEKFCYFLFEGINDRDAAENLRDWEVYADKEDVKLPDGSFFIDDIIGSKVTLDDGSFIGTVKEVLQYGAADVYVTEKDGREISFPYVADLVISIDASVKEIVLDSRRFSQVAVYDEN